MSALPIRIFIVDDQHLVRRGLVHMLSDTPGFSVVGEAVSGEQALEKLAMLESDHLPDVVLMDLRMPGMGGLEATRKLTQRFGRVRVIAVTGCDETPFPQRFLDCGASGFMTKDAGIDEVIHAIQMVQSGRQYLSQQVAQDIALGVVANPDPAQSPFHALSDRELQITLMIINGLKTSDMAEKLNVSPKTINTYRYRLFEKLKINSNMELALLASRHGLLEQHAP